MLFGSKIRLLPDLRPTYDDHYQLRTESLPFPRSTNRNKKSCSASILNGLLNGFAYFKKNQWVEASAIMLYELLGVEGLPGLWKVRR